MERYGFQFTVKFHCILRRKILAFVRVKLVMRRPRCKPGAEVGASTSPCAMLEISPGAYIHFCKCILMLF
jgi:hypothetical protein